ncbi:MAG: hypothetical protein ACPL3B_03505 [Fervidobacterium sp.]
MGVNVNIYVRKSQIHKMLEMDLPLFCTLVQWSYYRWYKFKEEILPDIEEYIYLSSEEKITSSDIGKYLMMCSKKLKFRETLAYLTEYDIVFAPDTFDDTELLKEYVEVYSLTSKFIKWVQTQDFSQNNIE